MSTPSAPPTAAEPRSPALAFSLARRVWALATPYFSSDQKWQARGLLATIVALNLGTVFMLVQINDWNRLFYDALQNKDQGVFWTQLGRFSYLAFGYIVIAVYKLYLTQLLEMRWRAWMTTHMLDRWLAGHAFYRMELGRYQRNGHAQPDNPDQRMADDLNQFTGYTVSLSMGLLNAVVTLVSFVGILWGLSGAFGFEAGGQSWEIPGFMVWAAVVYCAVGSVISHFIGRPLMGLNFEQQKREADFRHHLIRVREYSESIALDRGEAVENQRLGVRFAQVLANTLALMKAQKKLTWFTVGFGQAAVVFPFIVAAPRFFSGAIQLGELMQIASAFGRVQDSLSWFVDNYAALASWRATTDRLTSFEDSFKALALDGIEKSTTQVETTQTTEHWQADGLALTLPGGQALSPPTVFSVRAGDSVQVRGASGTGKSTLFRALAGIWPWVKGGIQRPVDHPGRTLFLPQRPYFPNGPLREALAYPEAATRYADAELHTALTDALLPQLVGRLDEEGAWGQTLSGGEQQRLAVARVLLKKPRWLFLDEATSALDAPAEEALYQRLQALVAAENGAMVSIAHRPGVAAFHRSYVEMGAPR
ncbi:MAG: ABC transporter ATP-binding protein/permease [Burkholderiaceae bacterium]